jgi:hypothetical protein
MGQSRVVGALQGQQPDLRAVAVGDDQFVLTGQRGERGDGFEDVPFLELRFRRFTPLKQGVPAEGGHDSHAGALRSFRFISSSSLRRVAAFSSELVPAPASTAGMVNTRSR